MKRLLEEARRMLRINSITASGNEELTNYVQSLFKDRGLKTHVQQVTHSLENVSKRQFNVIGILGDPLVDKKTRRGLLLNTHLDTVGPGVPENWTDTGGDPYAATIKEGKIFGLGAVDAKLDLVCKLHAIEKFREKKLRMPIYLVGTCGEEMGMFGARYLIKSLALNPKYVVIGSPTDLQVVHAHKCLSIFKVSIEYQQVERDARGFNRRIDLHAFGHSAHGSYPHLGVSAILTAVDFLQKASDNGFEIRFTRIDGGDTVNKVPDRAITEFYLTSHQFEDFKRFFRDVVRAEGKEKTFRVELGGLGDMGVRFLPDSLFPCLMEVAGFFRGLSKEFQTKKDESFDPPYSTVNFGMLKQRLGGLDLHFDLRLMPDTGVEETTRRVQSGIQAIASKYPNLNVSVARDRMNPGLDLSDNSELVSICGEAMVAAGLTPALAKKSISSEAAQFFQAGFDSVVFGPGVSPGVSHSPNEHCVIESLEKAVSFYEKLIERVCL